MTDQRSTKPFLTTKHTKVSDIDILKHLNFVLFVSFVVKCFFNFGCGSAALVRCGEISESVTAVKLSNC